MDGDLREQLEISKEFLEYAHGAAIRHGSPAGARAYYDAISLVDDALGHKWDVERAVGLDDGLAREFIKESREARANGVKAATLHTQAMEERRERYNSPSVLGRLRSRLFSRGD